MFLPRNIRVGIGGNLIFKKWTKEDDSPTRVSERLRIGYLQKYNIDNRHSGSNAGDRCRKGRWTPKQRQF